MFGHGRGACAYLSAIVGFVNEKPRNWRWLMELSMDVSVGERATFSIVNSGSKLLASPSLFCRRKISIYKNNICDTSF